MIKPYFNTTIHIKNLNTYRDFLKKRPTKTKQFKLSMIRDQSRPSPVTENGVQLKLLKALKTARPVRKVDLRECKIINSSFWEPKLIAACKRISKVKTFCLLVQKSYSEIKFFKYFSNLKSLIFQLDGPSLFLAEKYTLFRAGEFLKIPNYLKTLKYCPKISSLDFADADMYLPNIVIKPNSYLKSLESLALRGERYDQSEFPIDFCKNLRSISLLFPNLQSSLPQVLEIFSNLPNLQEIDFTSMRDWILDCLPAFKKITEKGTLKKVKFKLGYQYMSEIEKVLKALRPCKLTHFYLKAEIKGERLKPISQFVQSLGHLESLHLHIQNRNSYLNNDEFIELCRQISKLQALRSLILIFPSFMKIFKDATVLNFIPYLSDAFNKPIKIENFHLECNQLDSSQALQSLSSILENSAAAFLTHFKINIGILPYTNQTYRSILKLMRTLSNIQVFEIPCLAISGSVSGSSHFLSQLAEAVRKLKYLRVFEIGEIKDTVTKFDLLNAVERISSKRGLRKFHCQTGRKSEVNFRGSKKNRILAKNPYLETSIFSNIKIHKWTEN